MEKNGSRGYIEGVSFVQKRQNKKIDLAPDTENCYL